MTLLFSIVPLSGKRRALCSGTQRENLGVRQWQGARDGNSGPAGGGGAADTRLWRPVGLLAAIVAGGRVFQRSSAAAAARPRRQRRIGH